MSHVPPDFAVNHFLSEGHLALDLLNSEHFDYRGRRPVQDLLNLPAWVTAWTKHWQLPVTDAPGAQASALLRALRALLRAMLESMQTQQPITDVQLEQLNDFLALTPMRQQVERVTGGVLLVSHPLEAGWPGVVAQVAAAWADLLSRTPPERLKVCSNPDCHWAFVDQSHNLSRRWCRQWACGNLMKVRQFRERARHADVSR
jgi:predicted RNA-binding Zn ribbon-like protein